MTYMVLHYNISSISYLHDCYLIDKELQEIHQIENGELVDVTKKIKRLYQSPNSYIGAYLYKIMLNEPIDHHFTVLIDTDDLLDFSRFVVTHRKRQAEFIVKMMEDALETDKRGRQFYIGYRFSDDQGKRATMMGRK